MSLNITLLLVCLLISHWCSYEAWAGNKVSSSASSAPPPCATTCFSEPCGTAGLRYGKYCGVGHTGCPGVEPCDEIDKCCMAHDSCVGDGMGIFDVKCHTELKDCLKAIPKSAKPFEGNTCPWDTVKKAITAGMDLGIAFGSLLKGGQGGGDGNVDLGSLLGNLGGGVQGGGGAPHHHQGGKRRKKTKTTTTNNNAYDGEL
ncbi:phospholipase A2 [Pycnococcus provasolii]